MTRWVLGVAFLVTFSWTLLLLPWVQIQDQTLTGAELSDVITLLPALAILILLISLYGRLSKSLRVFAAFVLGLSSLLSFTTDFSKSAASIALQESITGLAGESSLAVTLPTPLLFGAVQLAICLMCLMLLRGIPSEKVKKDLDESDSRSLWESQS